jgi:hypothetical protein
VRKRCSAEEQAGLTGMTFIDNVGNKPRAS